MANYIYAHHESKDCTEDNAIAANYAKTHNIPVHQHVLDTDSIKTHWSERQIGAILKSAAPGDVIVVFDAAHLACSTSQILEILSMADIRKISFHFVKYNHAIENQDGTINTQDILALVSKIESDFISKRTAQALARRRAAGLPLGRPKGRGNKSLKLDKHKEDISKYLSLGISKASIAKLVDCHPQTLYDWLDRNKLESPVNSSN